MAQVINTNVASLNSQRQLNKSQSALSTTLERLSSGLRINSAKDDAAGLAISTRMSSQISGNMQASRNASDGISLAQTAEGSLQNVTDSLQRMRELAVQASNASNTDTDRKAIQIEVDQLVQQINTVAGQASFNGVKLLDGTFNSQVFQVGANAGETVTVSSIASAKAESLGVGTNSSYSTSLTGTVVAGVEGSSGAIIASGITVNGFGIGPSQTDGVSAAASNASAIAKAAAFNAVSGVTGVTAKANATSLTGVATTAQAAIAGTDGNYLSINGVRLGAIAAGTGASAAASSVAQGSNVAAAINAVSNQTGVTATINATTGTLSLSAADGRNISLMGAGAGAAVANTGLTVGTTTFGSAAVANTAQTALAKGDLTINGYDIGAVAAGTNATTQGANVAAAINALTSKTGVTATNTAGTLTFSTAVVGADITIDGNSANKTATTAATGLTFQSLSKVTSATISLSSTSSGGISLGGQDLAAAGLTGGNTKATSTFGSGISTVDVTTASGAQSAIATIDAALAQVNTSRANLGAIQNRFSAVVSNLANTSENLSASRSRILDADFAAETANLTRSQILQQAGTAMLSQANSLPQGVLSLLK